MSFRESLYYPNIDITNSKWLRTSVLFWDKLHTIVPESSINPYNNKVSRILADRKILEPIIVEPNQRIVEKVSNQMLNFLDTNECKALLGLNRSSVPIEHLRNEINMGFSIHPEKVHFDLRHKLHKYVDSQNIIDIDIKIAYYYMTILANEICEELGLALLTDDSQANDMKNRLSHSGNKPVDVQLDNNIASQNICKGALINLIIDGFQIDPKCSISTILKFKDKHNDELGLFRSNLQKLIDSVDKTESAHAMQKTIEDIYANEIKPSYSNLKKSLKGFKIKYISKGVLHLTYATTAGTCLPIILNQPPSTTLYAALGISVFATSAQYKADKEKFITENPYSYILSVKRKNF